VHTLTTAFVPLTLGHAANTINLLVPTAPLITAPSDMKAYSFDYLADSLLEYTSVYSSAKLITTFHHILDSTHNTSLKVGAIAMCIKSFFFLQ
jgi:hypothetical protein